MSLVGDIILELRSRIPDAPAVCNPPVLISAVGTNYPGAAILPNSPFIVGATINTAWGESNSNGVIQGIIGPNDNAILVTIGQFAGVPDQVIGLNMYSAWGDYGGDPNFLTQATAGLDTFPPINGNAQYILGLPSTPVQVHSLMPSRNTAFLPDTDGQFIGGYICFRLLNRAIAEMVKIAGGIIDVTGVQTNVNQSMYRIDTPAGQGSFYQFVNAWFDGYPMDIVQRSMMYLRNSAAGFSGILSYEQDGPSSVIQVWPQSNRTGGTSTLVQLMNATQNDFGVADGSGFLSIGLALIDQEIVAFSQVTNEPGVSLFQGVTRGLGGTLPAIHQPDATVTELNLRLSGYRMPPIYTVGQAYQTLMVPQAWETPLVLHMLSQVRSMEQDDAAAKSLMTDFVAMAEKIAKGSRLGRLKPRQIPIWGQTSSDARNVNGIGFGWLIN